MTRKLRLTLASVLAVAALGAIAPAANAYVYWANLGTSTIGRANLDGTGVTQSFITTGTQPLGIAVDGNHVYWTNYGNNTIGRAKLNGTGANQSFITGAVLPYAVAVDPSPSLTPIGKATKRSLKVKLGCGDASACSLRITGNKVGVKAALVPKTVSVGAGPQPTVTLRYSPRLRRVLAKGGRVSVTATNSATGGAKSITVRVAR
jgi:hypothetical protein